MKVKAKFPHGKYGFYAGKRVRDGDTLDLVNPNHFSEKWMEKLEEEKPKRTRKPKAVKADEVAEVEGA